jgi:hypothetical protein
MAEDVEVDGSRLSLMAAQPIQISFEQGPPRDVLHAVDGRRERLPGRIGQRRPVVAQGALQDTALVERLGRHDAASNARAGGGIIHHAILLAPQ